MKKLQLFLTATLLGTILAGCTTRDRGRTYNYEVAHHPKKSHVVAGLNEGQAVTTTRTTRQAAAPQYIAGA
jgi:hypothetical protein